MTIRKLTISMTIRDDYKKADYKLTISMTIRDDFKRNVLI